MLKLVSDYVTRLVKSIPLVSNFIKLNIVKSYKVLIF